MKFVHEPTSGSSYCFLIELIYLCVREKFHFLLLASLLFVNLRNRGGLIRLMTTLVFQFFTLFCVHFTKWEFIFMIFLRLLVCGLKRSFKKELFIITLMLQHQQKKEMKKYIFSGIIGCKLVCRRRCSSS